MLYYTTKNGRILLFLRNSLIRHKFLKQLVSSLLVKNAKSAAFSCHIIIYIFLFNPGLFIQPKPAIQWSKELWRIIWSCESWIPHGASSCIFYRSLHNMVWQMEPKTSIYHKGFPSLFLFSGTISIRGWLVAHSTAVHRSNRLEYHQ